MKVYNGHGTTESLIVIDYEQGVTVDGNSTWMTSINNCVCIKTMYNNV